MLVDPAHLGPSFFPNNDLNILKNQCHAREPERSQPPTKIEYDPTSSSPSCHAALALMRSIESPYSHHSQNPLKQKTENKAVGNNLIKYRNACSINLAIVGYTERITLVTTPHIVISSWSVKWMSGYFGFCDRWLWSFWDTSREAIEVSDHSGWKRHRRPRRNGSG